MKQHHLRSFSVLVVTMMGAAIVIFTFAFLWLNGRETPEPKFGVTFSWLYAAELGLDPLQAYQALVGELGVKRVRLPVYWSDIEHSSGEFDWTMSDELLALSEQQGVDLTLVVGVKVPRWPECYVPDWAELLPEDQQHQAALSFIAAVVGRYRDSAAVVRWQVENEPFFPFGQCPHITAGQYKERVDLVRSLDGRPIQVTVSGELGPWLDAAQAADVLGISLYRQTWNGLFGYFVYPLTPEYYFLRAQLVDEYVSKIIVSELQAEPWFPEPIDSRPREEWYNSFTVEMFNQNISFAREVGLSEAYLWGAEWWYALKQAGDDRLWEAAKELFL